jgi:hypothetical protein
MIQGVGFLESGIRFVSHDYHIWIERLLPAMVRGYVPENVWLVLAELCYFFRQLCAKELSRTMVADLEIIAPMLLCKLEKIFPPASSIRWSNLFMNSSIDQGILPNRNVIPFLDRVWELDCPISFRGSNSRAIE